MTDFNDFADLSAIERERDQPPDEPYFHGDPNDPADPPLDGEEDENADN